MTSNELKHEAKKQEWSISIQECWGSGLSVAMKATFLSVWICDRCGKELDIAYT